MKNDKPFGLEFLTEVEQTNVNGGRHHKKPGKPGKPHGPIFTTMAISMPSAAHPKGDNF